MFNTVVIGGSKGLGQEIVLQANQWQTNCLSLSRTKSSSATSQCAWLPFDLHSFRSEDMMPIVDSIQQMDYLLVTAGVGYQGDLPDQSDENIDALIGTLITGPLRFYAALLRQHSRPFHLVTVSSTTASKVRANETAYGAAKAGQAQMARNLHQELKRTLPGCKSTLVHPGGMQTPFWDDTNTDTSTFLDPIEVARIIWDEVRNQTVDWSEFSIIRTDGHPEKIAGTPTIAFP